MKDISDWAWTMIAVCVIAICVACRSIFSGDTSEDPLSMQIREVKNTYLDTKEKSKLISELIAKYNPTNTMSKIELK